MINDKEGGLDAVNSNSNSEERLGRVDTFSENLQILNDVINEFKQNLYYTDTATNKRLSWVDAEVILQMPINAEPFTARFNNLLTGWSAQLNIQVNNKNNLCITPIIAP